jgi:hypothetical protein
MYDEIIFVDFENFTQIKDDMKRANAKILVLVGMKQSNKAFSFSKALLDSVSSIELLKVKGQGKNALDFFIAYYLGVYTKENKKIRFTICSNDQGYDPLIKHLTENGIHITRLQTDTEPKNIREESAPKSSHKTQKEHTLFETDKDFEKAFNNIKNVPAKNRPRKIAGFEAHLKTIFRTTIKAEKLKQIISEFKKSKHIELENEKIKYNM